MTGNLTAIEVSGLEKRFGSFRAVKGIDFTVGRGEIYGFLGANGAGKSTTIKMLCGLLEPSGGTALVAGVDVAKDPEGVKRKIGYMCQKFSLYEDLTAAENVEFFGGIYGLAEKRLRQRRDEAFELLELTGRRDTFAGDLPRGFQQRLALACAIVHEPEIIFLDEPTAGVDPIQRRAFWDLIYSFSAAGTTIFVTTHFLDEAEFCHRISFIADGVLVAENSPAGLKELLSAWRLYEVRAADPATLLPAVRRLPAVHAAALFGDTLHVMADAAAVPDRLFAGVSGVTAVEPVAPTLEDVFLHIAGKKS
ncbi:MAG TPA: ABC transporter ATP-binding protein [bacterium]|nr:ABC transporter ATP-binding protein [bacterium]